MRIIERYLLKEFLKSFLYCLGAFIFLYIMADLFNYIDEMIRNHVPLHYIFLHYANFIPSIFVQVTPVAVLLSTVYVLGNSSRHNEITALRASGVSLLDIIKPFLVTGFMLSIMVFVVNDKIAPASLAISTKIRNEEIREVKSEKEKNNTLENIFIYGTENRKIFIRFFDAQKNILKEIIILKFDKSGDIESKSVAQEAHWQGNGWIFYDLSTRKLDSVGNMVGTPEFFKETYLDLNETPEDLKKMERRSEFMSYRELKKHISRFPDKNLITVKKLLVELHYKISFAFTSFVVILIAAPLAFLPNRGGILIGIGISILVALSYYAISAISIALGKAGLLPPFISAWMANFVFLILGIYLMRKKK